MKVSPLQSDRTLRMPRIATGMLIAAVLALIGALIIFAPAAWWLTPEQQAQRLFDRGEFAAAAERFASPQRRGAALFRAGEFKAAAGAFSRVNSADGHFNCGNALTMGGKYAEATEAYERALALRPDWPEAVNNLEIARLRAERTRQEGGDMTGGMLGADEIVFDTQKRDTQESGEEQVEAGQAMSDQELQALWLRRVQTRPADFLRAKFAFQLAAQQRGAAEP